MRRRAGVAFSMTFSIALCLFAQSSPDAYRGSYRSWREADPNLEQDSGSGGAAFAERTSRSAALAAKYAADRAAFLKQFAAANEASFTALENAATLHAPALTPDSLQRYVATEAAATAHYLEIYAKDTDAGILQLRQALELERASLTALSAAITERAKAAGVVDDAESVAEQARRQALDEHTDLVVSLKQAADQAGGDAAGWAEYYRKLAEGAKTVAPPPPPPPTTVSGVTVAHPAEPASASATPAITPVPLVRYTGAWTYPMTNGLFHGPQPVFIDLGVREENGRATGTLFARFKVPSGDPILRLEFTGEFKNTKTQVFKALTADGAKGTIELIPGPAFNLLEINVETEPKPGKVQRANMVLIKK